MTTETLADRVEALDGPCREMDCRIHLAANPEIEVMTNGGNHKGENVEYTLAADLIDDWGDDWVGFAIPIDAPRYTASLDAAMTLVPEGWAFTLVTQPPDQQPWAAVREWRWSKKRERYETGGHMMQSGEVRATTSALALVAAALRAQEAGE